jgi:hypothetical protein
LIRQHFSDEAAGFADEAATVVWLKLEVIVIGMAADPGPRNFARFRLTDRAVFDRRF